MAIQSEPVPAPAPARAPAVDVDEVLQSQAARHAAAVKVRQPCSTPAPLLCNRIIAAVSHVTARCCNRGGGEARGAGTRCRARPFERRGECLRRAPQRCM